MDQVTNYSRMGASSSSNNCRRRLRCQLLLEVIQDILSRLPIKALERFERVSEPWKAMIRTNPRFADLHFSRSSQNPMLILQPTVVTDSRPYVRLVRGTGASYQFSSIQLLSMMDDSYAFVNSCRGMICFLSHMMTGPIVIMNPVIRDGIILPNEEAALHYQDDIEIPDVSVGFGYHPQTNEYKVVKLFKLLNQALEVRLHVIGSGTWRFIGRLEGTKVYDESDEYERTILISGTLNWIVTQGFRRNKTVKILSFNVGSETFELKETPVFFNQVPSLGLVNLSERLAIYSFDGFRFRVSALKDYTRNVWGRLFSIPLVPAPPNSNLNPRYSGQGTIEGTLKDYVYLVDLGDRFGGYDAGKRKWEFICSYARDKFSSFLHVESLLSPRAIRANARLNRV